MKRRSGLPCKIIIGIDQFLLGGRETFIIEHVKLLKERRNCHFVLIANVISRSSTLSIFDEVFELGSQTDGSLVGCIIRLSEIVEKLQPSLIWGHHHSLLPFWYVAARYRVAFVASFHGPVLGAGRPSRKDNALGMTLALHRAQRITVVSEEIQGELASLGVDGDRVSLLPNRVRIPGLPDRVRGGGPVKLAMLTRMSKLGHIRAAVLFFSMLRRQLPNSLLLIYGGMRWETATSSPRSYISRLHDNASRLGRRWLMNHPGAIRSLGRIHFLPPAEDPYDAIKDTDIVLGMGRVVLEGIAAKRPTILVGYETVIGLVSAENLPDYARCNYSGRKATATAPSLLVQQVCDAAGHSGHLPKDVYRSIDIERHYEEISAALGLPDLHLGTRDYGESDVSRNDGLLGDLNTNDQSLLDALCSSLSVSEGQSLDELWQTAPS